MMPMDLYSRHTSFVLGFHGCDKSIAENVVNQKENLLFSQNDYDWLGNGIYFWENSPERALEWAVKLSQRPNSKIKEPAVLGAVIDLGYCLDLLDYHNLNVVRSAYEYLDASAKEGGFDLPQNSNIGNSTDLLLRKLDCAVIMTVHEINAIANERQYDSVRSAFWEGNPLYENAGFREKNHIQLCVRNLNCIKGYFLPRELNKDYQEV